jgi:hypothetical protein
VAAIVIVAVICVELTTFGPGSEVSSMECDQVPPGHFSCYWQPNLTNNRDFHTQAVEHARHTKKPCPAVSRTGSV